LNDNLAAYFRNIFFIMIYVFFLEYTMTDQVLPPMPKLRPRPGLGAASSEITPPPKKRKLSEEAYHSYQIINQRSAVLPVFAAASEAAEDIEEDCKTSRLLTKSECGRGGGRKRNSGSMIHSIPKFSQVSPY
jgi:hypothetical protein